MIVCTASSEHEALQDRLHVKVDLDMKSGDGTPQPLSWEPTYISLSSRISSTVWAWVKSPSLLSDRLRPQRQAVWPLWDPVPNSPRPCMVSGRSCPLPGEDCDFCSALAMSPLESFLGHFPRNWKFFSRPQALQPEWWASRKRPQCLRSSAFTCWARREQYYRLRVVWSWVHSPNINERLTLCHPWEMYQIGEDEQRGVNKCL